MNTALSHPRILTEDLVSLYVLRESELQCKKLLQPSMPNSGTRRTSHSTIPKPEHRWENIKLLYNCVFLMTAYVL